MLQDILLAEVHISKFTGKVNCTIDAFMIVLRQLCFCLECMVLSYVLDIQRCHTVCRCVSVFPSPCFSVPYHRVSVCLVAVFQCSLSPCFSVPCRC